MARPSRRRWIALSAVLLISGCTWMLLPRYREALVPLKAPSDEIQRMLDLVAALPASRTPFHPDATRKTEALVTQWMTERGYHVERQALDPATHPHRSHPPTHTLIASRDLASDGPLWVVGAHLDSVEGSPGADDNGSALAIAVTAASALAVHPASHRILWVFFAEEEVGMLGSSHWVDSLAEPVRDRIAGAIIMDVIGYTSMEPGSQQFPQPLGVLVPERGDFLAAITLLESRELLGRLMDARNHVATGLPLYTVAAPRIIATQLPDLWRSDHGAFWDAGIPALFLTDTANFRNPNYHQPTDAVATLDGAFMHAVMRTLVRMLAEAGSPD